MSSIGPAPGPGSGPGLNTPGTALGGTQTSLTLPGESVTLSVLLAHLRSPEVSCMRLPGNVLAILKTETWNCQVASCLSELTNCRLLNHRPKSAKQVALYFVLIAGVGLKNVHCLRTVFNVAHRLADSLGNSWGLVFEVLYTLDKALPAVGSGAGGKVCVTCCRCPSFVCCNPCKSALFNRSSRT